jgi:separase
MPTPDFMTEALTQENSLLLYCGHGGGEKFFSRSQVEEFINYYSEDESDRHRGCCSTVVLMGCSSGKLKSVNSPKNNPSGLVYPMYYEPEGIVLSYIYAGAPCVVGNLWDVTDRDIDR